MVLQIAKGVLNIVFCEVLVVLRKEFSEGSRVCSGDLTALDKKMHGGQQLKSPCFRGGVYVGN